MYRKFRDILHFDTSKLDGISFAFQASIMHEETPLFVVKKKFRLFHSVVLFFLFLSVDSIAMSTSLMLSVCVSTCNVELLVLSILLFLTQEDDDTRFAIMTALNTK